MNLLKSVIVLLGVFSFIISCSNPMVVDTSSQNKEEIVATTTTTIIFSIVPDTPKLMTIVERSKDGNKFERRKVETKTGKVTTIRDLKELKKIINDNEYLVFENGLTKEKIMNFKSRDDFGKHIKEYNNKNINRSIDWDFTWDMFRLENNLGEGNIEVSGRVVGAVRKIINPNDAGWWGYIVTIVEKNVAYVNYIYFTYDNGSFQPRTGTYPWGGNYTYYEWVSKWETILVSRDMVTIGSRTDQQGNYSFKGIKDGTELTFRVADISPGLTATTILSFVFDAFTMILPVGPTVDFAQILTLSPSLQYIRAGTENRTSTLKITENYDYKNRIDFQVAVNIVYDVMLNHIPILWDSYNKGIVMATILKEHNQYTPGESQIGGATVELVPINGGSSSGFERVYFNKDGYLDAILPSENGCNKTIDGGIGTLGPLPLPERGFKATVDGDGGVAFVNVSPGEYEIRASKYDFEGKHLFSVAKVKVDKGTVSNACFPTGVTRTKIVQTAKLIASNSNGGGGCNLTFYFKEKTVNGKYYKPQSQSAYFSLYNSSPMEVDLDSLGEIYKIVYSGGGGGGDSNTTHSLYLNNKVIYSWKGAYPPSNTLYDTNPPVTTTTLPLSIPFTIDAAVNFGNGKIYLFKGTQYCRYDVASNSVNSRYYPTDIQTNWSGMPWSSVDAAVNYGNGKIYFFKGTQYCRYDIATDRVDPGYYPADIQTNWSGMPWSSVDAAVNKGNGKIYFFKGTQYCRYDIATERVDPDYPVELNNLNWSGVKF